jgi:small subunit ribosomal protein S17
MAEEKETGAKGRGTEKVGLVVSNKMQKTIVVEVIRRVPHPLYKRVVTKRKKFYAHDEQQTAKMGDTVRIVECRPMSRLKRWTLDDVIRRAVQVAIEPSAIGLDTPAVVLPGSALPASTKRKPS